MGIEDDSRAADLGVGRAGEDLARVRARFGVDPATARLTLADAWTPPLGAVEEDETEFRDAVADCLSVGLPLDAALASWQSGTFVSDDEHDDGDDDEDDVTAVFGPAAR